MQTHSLTAEFSRNFYFLAYQSLFDIGHNLLANFSKLVRTSLSALLGKVLQDIFAFKVSSWVT